MGLLVLLGVGVPAAVVDLAAVAPASALSVRTVMGRILVPMLMGIEPGCGEPAQQKESTYAEPPGIKPQIHLIGYRRIRHHHVPIEDHDVRQKYRTKILNYTISQRKTEICR